MLRGFVIPRPTLRGLVIPRATLFRSRNLVLREAITAGPSLPLGMTK